MYEEQLSTACKLDSSDQTTCCREFLFNTQNNGNFLFKITYCTNNKNSRRRYRTNAVLMTDLMNSVGVTVEGREEGEKVIAVIGSSVGIVLGTATRM